METLLSVKAHVCIVLDLLTPQRLITTTTTMVDYMLVFVPQKILSLLGLLGQHIMPPLPPAEWKRIMDNRWAILVFLLCLVSPSTACLYTVCKLYAHATSLHLRFWRISNTKYRPGIWTTACRIVYNGSIWTQIFLKRCQGRCGGKIILVRMVMASMHPCI